LLTSSSSIGQVLFNLLIVLSPIYFYQLIFSHSTKKRTDLFAGLVFGFASILSMYFPILSGELNGGFLWDLRWVPFVICALYMGKVSTIICGLLLVGYRFTLGGFLASVNVLVVALILYLLIILIKKKYHELRKVSKVLITLFTSILTFFVVISAILLHFLYLNQLEFLYQLGSHLYLQMGVSYVIGIMIYAYFTESVRSNLKLSEQIHDAEKLNIVSELAASIAHEVRNPLTVVRGFIQLTKVKVDKELHHYMDTAIDELDRAESIISDYLNFAKPQQDMKTEEIRVGKSLKEIILLMQSYANIKGIKLEHHIEKDLYTKVDPFKFKQAILNLVKNAIEATDSGSVKITVTFCEKSQVISIQVIDTGLGMTVEQLQGIGKPYHTTKENGTGLGLMVTIRLIEAMGGTLKFESEPGKGTIVNIKFKGVRKSPKEQNASKKPYTA